MSKVLVFSDLFWSKDQREITNEEAENFAWADLNKDKFRGVEKYAKIVENVKPDIVLFSGDVTGDGSCGHGFGNAFISLLTAIEDLGITSYYISGDHDWDEYYSRVKDFSDKKLKRSRDISGKIVNCNGLSILGIAFHQQNTSKSIKQLLKAYRGKKIDFLLTHAEHKRRLWLFEFGAKIVISGHYDKRSFPMNGSRFVSLDNDHGHISYAVINDINFKETIEYVITTFEYGLEKISFTESIRENDQNKRNKIAYLNDSLEIDLSEYETLDPMTFMIAMHPWRIKRMKRNGQYEDFEKNLPINFNKIKYLDRYLLSKIRGVNLSIALSRIIEMGKSESDLDIKELESIIEETDGISKSIIRNYLGRII